MYPTREIAETSHAWKEGARLSACKLKKGAAAGVSAGVMVNKKTSKNRKPKPAEETPMSGADAEESEDEAEQDGDEAEPTTGAESDAETSGSEGGSPAPKRAKQKGGGKPRTGKRMPRGGFQRQQ